MKNFFKELKQFIKKYPQEFLFVSMMILYVLVSLLNMYLGSHNCFK